MQLDARIERSFSFTLIISLTGWLTSGLLILIRVCLIHSTPTAEVLRILVQIQLEILSTKSVHHIWRRGLFWLMRPFCSRFVLVFCGVVLTLF